MGARVISLIEHDRTLQRDPSQKHSRRSKLPFLPFTHISIDFCVRVVAFIFSLLRCSCRTGFYSSLFEIESRGKTLYLEDVNLPMIILPTSFIVPPYMNEKCMKSHVEKKRDRTQSVSRPAPAVIRQRPLDIE